MGERSSAVAASAVEGSLLTWMQVLVRGPNTCQEYMIAVALGSELQAMFMTPQ